MTRTPRTSHRHALAAAGVLCLTLPGCSGSNGSSPPALRSMAGSQEAVHSIGGSPPAAGHAGAITSRTLVNAQWGNGVADWSYYMVQDGNARIGPSVFADPSHYILYVTDPAHHKLRAYDDQTGKARESDEAPITLSSLEGVASPTSGDAYVLDDSGALQRIAGGRSIATLRNVAPFAGVGAVSGPLAVTDDDTVWIKSFEGWRAIARGGDALGGGAAGGGAAGGTPPTPEARLAGNTLLVGSGTAERRVALPASAFPGTPKTGTVTWAARSADSGVVWAVIAGHSRSHVTLIEVTPAGDVRSLQIPHPPDYDAPSPYALTSTGVAALNGNDPHVTLYSAG